MTVVLFFLFENFGLLFLCVFGAIAFSFTRVMGRIYPVTDKSKLFEEWLNSVAIDCSGESTNEDHLRVGEKLGFLNLDGYSTQRLWNLR